MQRLLIINIAIVSLLLACAGNEKHHLTVQSSNENSLGQKREIIVLPLGFRYVNMSRQENQADKKFEERYRDYVNKTLVSNFSGRGNSVSLYKVKNATRDRFNYFGSRSIFSIKGFSIDRSGRFSSACSGRKRSVLFAHSIDIKVGKKAYWNAFSGATGSNTSSSYYRLAVYDCRLRKRVWFGSVFFRELASVANSKAPLTKIYRKLNNIME